MTQTLVQFLRDRLNEDAAAAKRVESRWRQIGETGVIVASDGERAEECANGNWTGIAEHIIRHDPARILAEVEARRRVLGAYEDRRAEKQSGAMIGDLVDEYEAVLLPLLALPYADHRDYKEAWRP